MAENSGIELLDYLILVNRNKKFYLVSFFLILLSVYSLIYFFIPPQYDSTAKIIAVENSQTNPLSSIASSISNLPFAGFGLSGMSSIESYNLFTTIIFSRTNLEKVIDNFKLLNYYDLESKEEAIKILGSSITTEVTEEGAYQITVRAGDAKLAMEIVDFITKEVNESVIRLNSAKSRENRIFLEARYSEIQEKLASSENTLQAFQESSRFLEVTNQTKSIIENYSKLEAELSTKETEYTILKNLLGKDSPLVLTAETSLNEYRNEYEKLISSDKDNSIFLPIKSLPKNAKTYLRFLRDVEINTAMLQFIIPLLEQARFEEIKSVPILRVIDSPSFPEKKSYPPRTIFTLLITVFIVFVISIFRFILDLLKNTNNNKLIILRNELFRFNRKK